MSARQLADCKERLKRQRAHMVDAWLLSPGVIDNVANAMQHVQLNTMTQLAADKRIRVTVTPPSLGDGRFLILNRVGAFNVDQAAGETG